MAKKFDEAEVKKECPSCGLGVALDATICEFCGWDFEEEDEWILQIEKLERDLMLEKQKFEPGSVNGRIEATLHDPAVAMKAYKKAEQRADVGIPKPPEPAKTPAPAKPAPRPPPVTSPVETKPAPLPKEEAPAPKVRRVRTAKGPSSASESEGGLVTNVRTVRESPAASGQPEGTQKKVRLVRKVK
jgi:rubredoxin